MSEEGDAKSWAVRVLLDALERVPTDFTGMTRAEAMKVTKKERGDHDWHMRGMGYELVREYVPKRDRRFGDKAYITRYVRVRPASVEV